MDSAAVFGYAGEGCGDGFVCIPSGTVRGVCPEGWHLPSDGEWKTLFTAVGGQNIAGTKLKSTSGWHGGGDGTDAFGFSALPAGSHLTNGDFYGVRGYALFWSSTEGNSDGAYLMYLYYGTEYAHLSLSGKSDARSVRCLKD